MVLADPTETFVPKSMRLVTGKSVSSRVELVSEVERALEACTLERTPVALRMPPEP